MATLRRIKLNGLNAHITCTLCQGYYVEATTIIECLHTFCRTCIVRYLETSTFCPVCEVQVHKTKPLLSLREDKTLQDVVYKLVPDLYRNEMERRVEFYHHHPEAGGDRTERSLREKRHFFHIDDHISLSLEFLPPAHAHAHALGLRPLRGPSLADQKEHFGKNGGTSTNSGQSTVPHKRYIKCQAAVQIRLLEKFIRLKYTLSDAHRVDIVHGSDCLSPELTLLDVVYSYKYTEDGPLVLQYTVIAPPPTLKRKKPKQSCKAPQSTDEDRAESDTKKQKLDCPKTPKKESESSTKENVSDGEARLSAASIDNTDDQISPMSIEEEMPPKDSFSVDVVKSAKDPGNTGGTTTGGASKVREANSSIESLTQFVNSAPGLSGFQSDPPKSVPVTEAHAEPLQTEATNINTCPVSEPSKPVPKAVVVSSPSVKPTESQCSLNSASGTSPISVAPHTINMPNGGTSVMGAGVRPSVFPNISDQLRPPQLSSPRVVLHRPPNIGFTQGNNPIRYNNVVPTGRPVDPTKPRLGRPPNAARVAAAAAGRAVPQPILPRTPGARPQFSHNTHIIGHRGEGRGRPKKRPVLVKNRPPAVASTVVPVSAALQAVNHHLQTCSATPLDGGGNIVPSSNCPNATSNSQQQHVPLQQNSSAVVAKVVPTANTCSSARANINGGFANTAGDNVLKTPPIASTTPKNAISIVAKSPHAAATSKGGKYVGGKKPCSGTASRLSSITDNLLVSKQISQLNEAKSKLAAEAAAKTLQQQQQHQEAALAYSAAAVAAASMPSTVPAMMPQMCPGLPFNPALAAVYMSAEYSASWFKQLQTAAVYRDSLQATLLASQRTTSPNKNDPKPMDLSPTSKSNNVNGGTSTTANAVPSATSGVGSQLSYLQSATSNSSTSDIVTKPANHPARKSKDATMNNILNTKFNNNNNISLLGNLHHNTHNRNVLLENFAKPNFSNTVTSSALNNNSPITKCTSVNQPQPQPPRIVGGTNQVPLKCSSSSSNPLVPARKNGLTAASSLKSSSSNCDNNKSGRPEKISVGGGDSITHRSSPTPAITPTATVRSHHRPDSLLNSVPSPKAGQSASPNSPATPTTTTTISPPTPEVTITKLPSSSSTSAHSATASSMTYPTSVPTPTQHVTSGSHHVVSGKMVSSHSHHTNTVSITKRPSGTSIASVANKLAVVRSSPSASVRQIPNPSRLAQKSEVRNSKNVRVDN